MFVNVWCMGDYWLECETGMVSFQTYNLMDDDAWSVLHVICHCVLWMSEQMVSEKYVLRDCLILCFCLSPSSKGKVTPIEGTAVVPDLKEPAKLGVSFSYCESFLSLFFCHDTFTWLNLPRLLWLRIHHNSDTRTFSVCMTSALQSPWVRVTLWP